MGLAYQTPNMASYIAGADLSAKQYCFVKFGTVIGTVVICGAGDKPIGILMSDTGTSGSTVDVALPGGGAKLKAGGTIGKQAFLKADSAGEGVATTAAGDSVGAFADSIGSNASDGDIIPVIVMPAVTLGGATQGAAVAALAGTLTGTTDGTIADVAAVSTAGGNTYADSAINTAITSINLQLKELQVKLNELAASVRTAAVIAT